MSRPAKPVLPPDASVVIVGAGMSGLVAARELSGAAIDFVVVEAADRVGGRMMGETSPLGSRLDLGGQWIGRGHHRFEALAAELGASTFPMRTPRSPAIADGDDVLSATSGATLLATAGLLGAEVMSHLPARGQWNSTTLDHWLARVPSARARRALEVITAVTATTDTDRLSVAAFLSLIRFQGGLVTMMKTKGGAQDSLVIDSAASLTERLAMDLGDRVHTGCRVTAIRQSADDLVVETSAGPVRADRVIVAVPPPMASKIEFDPPLPASRDALHRNTYMGSVYKAIAVYETPFWRDNHAEMIFLDHPGCAVFDTSPPRGPGHLCLLIGGRDARALDDGSAEQRQHTLLRRLEPHLGAAVSAPVSWHEKSWHLDSFVGGGYVALPEPGTRDGFFPIDHRPCGAIHWAGTEMATEHAGYIEGAIESGARTAGEVLATLSRERHVS